MVVICSTTGDGDPPETVARFWRQLKKKTLSKDHLAHLDFALLGLGDTNYSNFAQMGKNFEKRFVELGAKSFCKTVYADDAVGLEIFVEPWRADLMQQLRRRTGLDGGPADPAEEAAGKLNALALADSDQTLTLPKAPKAFLLLENTVDLSRSALHAPAYYHCRLTRYRCLSTPDAVKRTLEVELELPPGVCYEPGDAFAVRPLNRPEEVDALLIRLGMTALQASDPVCLVVDPSVKKAALPEHLPPVCTLRQALLFYCDIRAYAPKKTFLLMLSEYTSDPAEKAHLQLLSSRQGQFHEFGGGEGK